jgi:hypothetical protein
MLTMSYMTIRDDAIWAKHIEGDPALVEQICALPENAMILLLIEGTPVRFVKMRDGSDGRPTAGLRPADAEARHFWRSLQARRGEQVQVSTAHLPHGTYLASLSALLSEWESPEDAAAYDRL